MVPQVNFGRACHYIKCQKVYCMSMREKWKVVKKLSFGRYLHTTKSIGPNRLVHVGGYGQHPVEVWVGEIQSF